MSSAYAGLEYLLWASLFVPAYTYAIYPVLLIAVAAAHQIRQDLRFASRGTSQRAAELPASALPSVAVLVAAYNEQRHVVARVHNLLACGYPAHLLRIYVGSDGSSSYPTQRHRPDLWRHAAPGWRRALGLGGRAGVPGRAQRLRQVDVAQDRGGPDRA